VPCETYRIEAPGDHFEAFAALDAGYQARVVRLLEHVRVSPTARFPGLKRLRGRLDDIWEFRVGQSQGAIRLNYTIDEDACAVHIEYLGPHPDYSRSRGDHY
jgi:hypothetical protein